MGRYNRYLKVNGTFVAGTVRLQYLPTNLVAVIFCAYVLGVFHVVDEGHIGVYTRGGALLNTWTEPGLHYMLPIITTVSARRRRCTRCRSRSRRTRSPTSRYELLDVVRHQQRSHDHLREDRGCQQAEEEPGLRNHQELHGVLRPDLDLQQDTVQPD